MNAASIILRSSTIILCAAALAILPMTEASGARGSSSGSSSGSKSSGSQRSTSSSSKSTSGRRAVPKRYQSKESRPKPPTKVSQKPPRHPPKYPPRHPKPPKYPPREPPVAQKPPRKPYPRPPVIVAAPLPTPSIPAPNFLPPSGPGGGAPRIVTPQRRPSTVPPVAQLNRSRDREIIIAMEDATSDGDTITLGQGLTLNVEVQYRSSLLGLKIVRLRIPDNRSLTQVLDQVIQAQTTDPRIVAVQPNYVFQTSQSSTAAAIRPLPQYAIDKVRLSEAHRARWPTRSGSWTSWNRPTPSPSTRVRAASFPPWLSR